VTCFTWNCRSRSNDPDLEILHDAVLVIVDESLRLK